MRFKIRNLVIFGFVAALIAAAFFLGILDWNRIRPTISQTAKNISAEVGAGNLLDTPSQVTKSTSSSAAKCRDHLRRIETAKRAVASKTGINIGSVSWDAVIKELKRKPKCPNGGTYKLGNHQVLARCSIGANGTSAGADDHLIDNF